MKDRMLLVLLSAGLILFYNCASMQTINGNGKIITQEISIDEYDAIELGGGHIVVHYVQNSEKPVMTVSVDQNIFDIYEFVTSGKTLKVKPKNSYHNANIKPTKFIVETNSANLNRVVNSGSLDFNLNSPYHTDKLTIRVSGSGHINLKEKAEFQSLEVGISGSGTINADQLAGGNMDVTVSGSGRFNLGGYADKAAIKISGSGRVNGFDIQVKDMECRISGSGNIEIGVTNSLDARISGSGSIQYKGDPQHVNSNVSGSGSVKKVTD